MDPCIVYFERVVYYEDQDNLKRLFFGLAISITQRVDHNGASILEAY